MRQAFSSLSDRDREALALVAWDGVAPREVAVVLGVPAQVAAARLFRARRRLPSRTRLSSAEGPDPGPPRVTGTQGRSTSAPRPTT